MNIQKFQFSDATSMLLTNSVYSYLLNEHYYIQKQITKPLNLKSFFASI